MCLCRPMLYEFHGMLRSALPGHTPLIIYNNNPAVPLFKLQHYAQKTQVSCQSYYNCFIIIIIIIKCLYINDNTMYMYFVGTARNSEVFWI